MAKFVELYVDTYHPRGNWGEPKLINCDQIKTVEADKNWTRVFLKDGTDFLVTKSYEETAAKIKRS